MWILLFVYGKMGVIGVHPRLAIWHGQLGRSLIYNRNNNKIVRWGTPQLNDRSYCQRGDHWWNTFVCGPLKMTETIEVYRFSFFKKLSWSTGSKAFFKSRNTTSLILPRSIMCASNRGLMQSRHWYLQMMSWNIIDSRQFFQTPWPQLRSQKLGDSC